MSSNWKKFHLAVFSAMLITSLFVPCFSSWRTGKVQQEQYLLHRLFGRLDKEISPATHLHLIAPFSTGLASQYIRLALAPRPFFIDSMARTDTILLALPNHVSAETYLNQRKIIWSGNTSEFWFYLAVKTSVQP